MNQFCEMKGIKREFIVARTSQQNEVAERKNRTLIEVARTLIEVARTMLANSKLTITFWAEAVNTACYVQNRVLVIMPHNKTPYELFLGYSTNSKAFRVFNSRTRIVEENLHVMFSEDTPNIAGSRPNWLFDIDALTKSMNYEPVVAGNQSNGSAGTKACDDTGKARMETVNGTYYILLPFLTQDPSFSSYSKDSPNAGFKPLGEEEKIDTKNPENENSVVLHTEEPRVNQEQDESINITNNINIVSLTVNTASIEDNALDENITLVDLPHGKRAIGTKWVYKNKKDKRGIVIRNKARLVAQGYTQEEGINYDEVFALVDRIEAIRLFLAYASYKDFVVYKMDMKSAFLYGKIEEEVYVCQPVGFEDLDFPNRVYKVEKALYGLHQAPKACDVKQHTYGKTHKPLVKDADGEDIDEHIYRSMIGLLMYLTSSRPDIIFVVCVCARFQVNPKVSHLHAVKRIFRYLKGASLDRKSTIGDCQFLGCRLISWQCKKHTVVVNSIIEAEYIAASNCYGQVLCIQNQLLDY
ncbi:retrovirus-related pol polyprotein from transposon TNT 1-94, partial [Tanacetum coccineum]